MFINITGGEGFIQPSPHKLTLAMTDPTGSVVVEQMGDTSADWFTYMDNGESANLDSNNTAKSIYAPIKLRITATGTGVRLYNRSR